MSRQLLAFGGQFLRARAGGDPFAALFADGTDGFDYNPALAWSVWTAGLSDTAVGGSEVATDNEFVGMIADTHAFGGLSLEEYVADATNLISNGGFDDTSAWTESTTATVPDPISGGEARILKDGTGTSAVRQAFTAEVGKNYLALADLRAVVTDVKMWVRDAEFGNYLFNAAIFNESGKNGGFFTSTVTAPWLHFNQTNIGKDGYVDNAAIIQLPDQLNNARQMTGTKAQFYTSGIIDSGETGLTYDTGVIPDGAGNTLVFQGSVRYDHSTKKIFAGVNDLSGGKFAVGVDATGHIFARLGTDDEATIIDTADLRGTSFTGALTHDGSNVELKVNGQRVYYGAQNGTPSTTNTIYLFGNNNNGTAAEFADQTVMVRAAMAKKSTLA